MAQIQEESACGTGAGTRAAGRPRTQEAGSSADWSHANRVGNYTNGEAAIPQDAWFHTPFAGAEGLIGKTCPVDDDGAEPLPVEAGRYRLIWTPFCPWATRTRIVLGLLGIGEDVISTGKVDLVRTKEGWKFSLDPDGKDPVLGVSSLPELYERTEKGGPWRATVPVLADTKTGKVANNDYHHLPNYLETVWKPFGRKDAPDLYPAHLRTQIDRLNRILFNEVTNRVYLAGYAETQAEYEHSFYIFFHRLDLLDRYLETHRFLMGDQITDPDIRLFVTLARLDCAYYFEFHLNERRLRDYPNLWNYAKELYSIPAIHDATDFDAIKRGYYLGDAASNPWRIVPDGPDQSVWDAPNDRTEKFGPLRGSYGQKQQAKEER
ncbi:MAG: glutathione S-transferase C-terminal domain-containing protein [Lachnospiraceae bacterium]